MYSLRMTHSMTPEDNLWLAILEREPKLGDMKEGEVRLYLREGGFPEKLVEEFLKSRTLITQDPHPHIAPRED